MCENVLEKLEEIFPNGFVIVYPNKNETHVRMVFVAEKETNACAEMQQAVQAIKEKLTKQESKHE